MGQCADTVSSCRSVCLPAGQRVGCQSHFHRPRLADGLRQFPHFCLFTLLSSPPTPTPPRPHPLHQLPEPGLTLWLILYGVVFSDTCFVWASSNPWCFTSKEILNVTDFRRERKTVLWKTVREERWPKVLVRTWEMRSICLSAEERSCLEGVDTVRRSENKPERYSVNCVVLSSADDAQHNFIAKCQYNCLKQNVCC